MMKKYKNILSVAAMAAMVFFFAGAQAQTPHVTIGGSVFGGGNMAAVGKGTTVLIDQADAEITGDVYGGGALAEVDTSRKSNPFTTLGALQAGDSIVVTILQGSIGHDVYGGGLGNAGTAANVYGPVFVNIGTLDGDDILGSATINGMVFGGNNINGTPKDSIHVNIWKTARGGAKEVGSFTEEEFLAYIRDNASAHSASSFALQAVYGGSNKADYVPVAGKGTKVWVHGCSNTVKMLYGGGRAAAVGSAETNDPAVDSITANTFVIVDGGRIDTLFAGGDGHTTDGSGNYLPADIHGNVNAHVRGGLHTAVFGASNTAGSITGNKDITIDKSGPCEANPEAIGTLFGGGNMADAQGNLSLTVECGAGYFNEVYGGCNLADVINGNVVLTINGGHIGNVYGGSKGRQGSTPADSANIGGNVTLNLHGGTMTNAFGGSNINGNITGSITVNVEDAETENCELDVTNIYGAGNLTAYTPADNTISYPQVNIKHIKSGNSIHGNVFGGGKQASVTANPVVNIGNGSNGQLATISGNVFGGGDEAGVNGATTVNMISGSVATGLYGGCNTSGTVSGNITVALTGGTVGTNGTTTDVVYGGGYGHSTATGGDIAVTLNGTTVYGNLYGGSALGSVNGSSNTTTVTIGGSGLNGKIFGGGMGSGTAASTQATTLGDVVINYNTANSGLNGIYGGANVNGDVAGDIAVNIEANVGATGAGNSVDIFGGGLGQYTTTDGNVTVTIGNSATPTIYGDVYGGSGYGEVGANGKLTKVDFKKGTLNGTIYGGGMGQGSPAISATVSNDVEVAIAAGTITTGVYGGCNERGNVGGDITVDVTGGTIGANGSPASVFGGGYGANTTTGGDVLVNINGAGVTVWGDVYGGSGLGDVNGGASNTTTVNILNGEVKRDVFGGGLGSTSPAYAAAVNGVVTVNIGSDNGDGTYSGYATIGGNVYGCNNTNGSPQQDVTVNIYGTAHTDSPVDNTYSGTGYALANVFGGGKEADFNANGKKAYVNVYSCANTIGRVFGGGDAAAVTGTSMDLQGGRFNYVFGGGNGEVTAANVGTSGINLAIHGGTIGTLVSGSNTQGTISGPINVQVDNNSGCSEEVTDFFGGSNQVDIATDVTTTIACGAGTFRNVYGGSNAANITGNVTLNLYGGTMEKVFGGSKGRLADPDHSITAKVANISGDVTLNLYGGTITDAAFGGSDQNGNIGGTITVNVLDHQGDCKLDVNNIYGAGNLTAYTPDDATVASPTINVMHVQVRNDNPATTDVDESVPGIRGNVFGGGLGSTAVVTANPRVNIGYDATTMETLPGVHYPAAIDRAKNYTAIVCGSVFGGGDAAAVTGSPIVKTEHYNTRVANLYGGGNNIATGGVSGSTTITMNNGTVTDGVYGGCNVKGTVAGNTTVDILGGTVGSVATNGRIFGGGFGQNTNVDGNVHVTFGDQAGTATPILYGDLYGGSALGAVNTKAADLDASGMNTTETTTLDILSGTIVGNIFGGGLGQQYAAAVADDPNTTDVDESSPEVPAIAAIVHGKIQINVGYENASHEYVGNATLNAAAIYGCNNVNGTPQHDVYIDIYGTAQRATDAYGVTSGATFAISRLYGGGNRADYAPTNIARRSIADLSTATTHADSLNITKHIKKTHIYIHGCANTIDRMFGGGNAAAVPGDSVLFDGGRYGDIFGGGNGVLIPANVGDGGVYLYGKGGLVGYIYQQCNRSGSIAGPIDFTQGSGVSSDCNQGILKVQYKFSGGNEQDILGNFAYTYECSSTESEEYTALYGGCRLGTTYGNITLTIKGGTFGTIYGGAKGDDDYAANIKRFPTLEEINADQQLPAAQRKFSAEMVNWMSQHSDLYGTGGNVLIILEGGTIGDVFGGCDLNGSVEGTVTIIVDSSSACPLEINNIYGGGNLASYNPLAIATNPDYAYPYIDLRNGHVNQNVYGGGKGSTASVNHGKVTSNPYVHMHPDVANSKSFLVKGDLYGGGELGQVVGNTKVLIEKGTVKGSVYGAGLGDLSNENFGLVAKNTWVDMQGGLVERSVYGGGELASVGTFTEFYHAGNGRVEGEPKTCATGTGLAKVTLSNDAQVGVISMALMPPPIPEEDDYGYIFCGSRGEVDSIHNPNANKLAVVGNTYLQIGGSALVTSAAYGGCENGQVLNDTYVKITGDCQIGVGYNDGTALFDPKYTTTQWNVEDPAEFHECSHWPYGSPFAIYDPYATHEYNGEYYYDDEHTQSARGGSANPSNGHTFYGNVFGGGSGYYAIEPGTDVNHATWRRSAGRVNGNTVVDVDGGHILNNLYGGNEMTDVLGSCTVNFSGGTLGVPRTLSDIQAHPVSCYLFGAGKGDARTFFNKVTNVGSVTVNVTGGRIFGSVFGGGEDGHVIGDVEVNISGNATKIGTLGTSYVDGNVFGGGRGFDGIALTAGNVGGNITVNITSGTMLGSVYGGGRLASVGCDLCNTNEECYGVISDNTNRGKVTVNITGGTIGNDVSTDYSLDHPRGGNVFGGSMGRLVKLNDEYILPPWSKLGSVRQTIVNISGGTIKSNVYGGSELGSVTGNTYVNIYGSAVIGVSGRNHGNVYGGGYGHAELTSSEVNQITPAVSKQEIADSVPLFAGRTYGNTHVSIYGNATLYGDVYGGGERASVGNESYYDTTGNTTVNIGTGTVDGTGFATSVAGNATIIGGDVYGANNISGTPLGNTQVNIFSTHRETNEAADYTGESPAFALDNVFGGGNHADYEALNTPLRATVHVYGCANTIERVFGGGDAAAAFGGGVIIDGGRFDKVFGGGNGEVTAANIGASGTNTQINGGIINMLFGGSNEQGVISGPLTTVVSNTPTCAENITEFYAGSNLADIVGDLNTTIACSDPAVAIDKIYGGCKLADIYGSVTLTVNGGTFTEVYGGSRGATPAPGATAAQIAAASADIKAFDATHLLAGRTVGEGGDVTLNIYGGTMTNVFGGSDLFGNVEGVITVTIDSSQCPLTISNNVYGGGDLATCLSKDVVVAGVTQKPVSPVVNLLNGTVGNNVFGGGKGAEGDTVAGLVTSNPMVVMNPDIAGGKHFRVMKNIYGGGELASVGRVHYATAAEATAYNSAHPNAGMAAGDVLSVAEGSGNIVVDIQGGTVGPNNVSSVDIDGHGDVFGGGLGQAGVGIERNMAYVNNTSVTVSGNSFVKGSVFGGGENGHVQGNTAVAVSGGTIGVRIPYSVRSFDPEGPTGPSSRVYSGNVYGGGRGVDNYGSSHLSLTAGRVYGNTSVTVSGSAHVRHAVYGGGSLASVGTFTRTVNNDRFGGYDHTFEPNTGLATVTISGGIIGPSWDDLNTAYDGTPFISAGAIVSDAARDSLIRNYACLGENEGMVYGSGRGVNIDPNASDADHRVYAELAFTNNTVVNISGTADVRGSVFGGGENGHVMANTQVNISDGKIGGMRLHHNGFTIPETAIVVVDDNADDDELAVGPTGTGKRIFRGNVYGGGRGVDHTSLTSGTDIATGDEHLFSSSAGRVYGNTEVNISGGKVLHNVFGGGSIASVGTYVYPDGTSGKDFFADPINIVAGTGRTDINISGGRIGVMGENEGGVYGGGRGIAASTTSQATHLAYVNETHVNLSATDATFADVRGSVFGGGMNGHVLNDTYVTISGGIVGGKTAEDYGSWDVINFPESARPAAPDTTFTLGGTTYRYYAGIRAEDTLTDHYGRIPTGIAVFLGNVYGGGRGVDTYTSGGSSEAHLSLTAGRVYGNTNVLITGGLVYHNVYGGGSIATVGHYTKDGSGNYTVNDKGGKATVDVRAGRLGTTGRNNGRVFGSGRGMAGTNYAQTAYVNIAHVTIGKSDDPAGVQPYVRGSVFGSGENGHVLDSTLVVVNRGEIGHGKRVDAQWINKYIGNVYGGGRGVDLTSGHMPSATAGWVGTSTHVIVNGGHIHNSVYGGGSLGSVGPDGTVGYTDVASNEGRAWVDINGGLIGIYVPDDTLHSLYGSVYGASRGRPGIGIVNNNDWSKFAFVTNTVVRVNYSTTALPDVSAETATGSQHIVGNVFGGGNNGHVNNSTYVTVTRGRIGSDGNKGYGSLEGNVFGGGSGEEKYSYYHRNAAGKYCDASGNAVTFPGTIPVVSSSLTLDTLQYLQGSTITPGQLNYVSLGIAVTDTFSTTAGLVYGNATVDINGATRDDVHVMHHVYGGGSMASVGDYWNYPATVGTGVDETETLGEIYPLTASHHPGTSADHAGSNTATGICTVTITGGTFGTDGINNGIIYGGCRGLEGNLMDIVNRMSYFNDAHVTLGTTSTLVNYANPQILVNGSIFGGGENGHGVGSTYVTIHDGKIGNRGSMYDRIKTLDDKDEDGTITVAEKRELDSLLVIASNCGNVYGGGCGTDKYYDRDTVVTRVIGGTLTTLKSVVDPSQDSVESVYRYNPYCGIVYGNTSVVIDGGYVEHNVYGGGSMANTGTWVGAVNPMVTHTDPNSSFALSWPTEMTVRRGTGKSNVSISDNARIGYSGSDNGDVFGAARGEAGDRYEMARYANVYSSTVTVDLPMPAGYDYTRNEKQIKNNVIKQYGTIVPLVAGSVYGGSEKGQVTQDASLTLTNGIVGHCLYGGGKGKGTYVSSELKHKTDGTDGVNSWHAGDDSTATVYSIVAGKVFGNTSVTMIAGHVVRNIFGGGNLGSVGKGNYAGGLDDYRPSGYGERWPDDNLGMRDSLITTGNAVVTVNGGYVGALGSEKDDLPTGNVFGGARGEAAPFDQTTPRYLYSPAYFLGYVNNTSVTIGSSVGSNSTPQIYGSVYGGGQDGHVRGRTVVNINDGVIGCQYNSTNITLQGTDDKEADMWKLRGNVFGAGSGLGQYTDKQGNLQYNNASGSVTDSTVVFINGGQVARNVYGGGSFATVGPPKVPPITDDPTYAQSHSRVIVSGGTVGYTPTNLANTTTFYGGDVFGAGRGLSGDDYKGYCDVPHTVVKVTNATVKGSVYGGAEDGHVIGDTRVDITTGAVIGFGGTIYLKGNVFGGGKGSGDEVDHDNNNATPNEFRVYKTSGRVGGNIAVTMDDGLLHGSLFGGGRLALSGVDANGAFTPNATDFDVTKHGNVTVTVTGGTIGTTDPAELLGCDWSSGDIMGSGKGDIENYSDVWAGRVTNATVTITGSPVVRGSVFGGGEMASIGWWNNNGVFYSGTGAGTVTIGTPGGSDNPIIGLAEEITYYTKDNNPGEWTIYDNNGKIVHTITGNVFGGSQGDIDISKPHWVSMAHSRTATVTINKGTIRSTVYGGSEQGMVNGNTYVTINDGTIGTETSVGSATPYIVGGVYAAGYGSDDPADELPYYPELDANGDPIGANLPVPDNDSVNSRAGLTATPLVLAGRTYGDAHVDVLGGHILGSVYGGGENASVGYETSSSVGNTFVNIGNPTGGSANIDGDVFGANNLKGTPYGNTNVNIYHTAHIDNNFYPDVDDLKALAAPTDALTGPDLVAQYADQTTMPQTFALNAVYGGGNKAAHTPHAENGVANVHVWFCDENTIKDVYGGGNAADTKNNHLIIDGGRINRVFGGGNGYSATGNHTDAFAPNYNPGANVNGIAHTEVKGGLIDSVWGGSNQLGYILNIDLDITHEDPLCPEVIVQNTAGGNEAPSGGGVVTVSCGAYQENFYAGGSFSDVGTPDNPTTIVLNVEGGHITNLYAGCQGDRASYGEGHSDRAANVYGDITLNFHGGNVTNLFGGSHRNGNITGTVTVNVDVDPNYTCPDGLRLDFVYGGGQEASYTPTDLFRASPTVNIMNNRYYVSGSTGTMADSTWVRIQDVFGGGLGATAVSTSYPRVIIGGFADGSKVVNAGTPEETTVTYTRGARIFGNVYGGGSAAPVVGNTYVMVRDAVIGSDNAHGNTFNSGVVYGGGYGATAKVTGETYVGIFGKSDIKNNVYGGGNAGIVTGSTEIQIGYHEQILPVEIIGYLDGSTVKAGLHCATQDELPAGKTLSYRYTLDGTTPTVTSGTTYTGDVLDAGHDASQDFVLDWGHPVQAIAYLWDTDHDRLDSSMIPSVISFDLATAPTIDIKRGTAHEGDPDTVTLNGTVGARILYTTDGSEPKRNADGTLAAGTSEYGIVGEGDPEDPFTITHDGTQVVKALVEMRGCFDSHVNAFVADKPVVTLEGNQFKISAAQPGDRIIYTTDSRSPVSSMSGSPSAPATEYGTKVTYTGTPITVDATTTSEGIIKVIVERTGYMPSRIEAKEYRP